jgi:hypothetical protein
MKIFLILQCFQGFQDAFFFVHPIEIVFNLVQ